MAEQNEQTRQQQETARMENVIKNGYKAGLISFSIALVTGADDGNIVRAAERAKKNVHLFKFSYG